MLQPPGQSSRGITQSFNHTLQLLHHTGWELSSESKYGILGIKCLLAIFRRPRFIRPNSFPNTLILHLLIDGARSQTLRLQYASVNPDNPSRKCPSA